MNREKFREDLNDALRPLFDAQIKLDNRLRTLEAIVASDPNVQAHIRSQRNCEHDWNRRRDGRWCNKCLKVELGVPYEPTDPSNSD
jgi:hypothetical protein